jgi:hypothetical protein
VFNRNFCLLPISQTLLKALKMNDNKVLMSVISFEMQIESFFSRRKWACCKKVKEDGVMVSPLDLAHHKPYECLLLGYLPCQPPLGTDNKVASLKPFQIQSASMGPCCDKVKTSNPFWRLASFSFVAFNLTMVGCSGAGFLLGRRLEIRYTL